MGCDYYTYVITRIQFTNAKGAVISYDEKGVNEGRYYYGGDPEYDPDLEEPVSYSDLIKAAIDRESYSYGEKNLFVNGQWICQPAGKERIIALCTSKKIPLEALVRVYKFKTGRMR